MSSQTISVKKSNNNITFEGTFPICTMGLIMSCLYPQHNQNYFKKLITLILIYITIVPGISFITYYMFYCIQIRDLQNFSRQIIIELVLVIFICKTAFTFAKGKKVRHILDIISNDFKNLAEMDQNYKDVAKKYVKLGKRSETLMFIVAIIFATLYPGVSIFSMLFTFLFTDDKYKNYDNMVNPVVFKNFEEKQFEKPYFEIIWLYQTYMCVIMSPSFAGIDGSFGIACAHASLKFEVMKMQLQKALKDSLTIEEVKFKLKPIIDNHVNAKKFYETVRDVYQDWLLLVYLLSSGIISLNLYQISTEDGMNPQYLIFLSCAIVHIYIPCYYATIINEVSDDLPNEIYLCAWENWSNTGVTKTIMLMIAYAQRPLTMKARGLLVYDMNLFVSTLKASYSFYTLIRS